MAVTLSASEGCPRSLRWVGLMANPKKCAIGSVEVWHLGFHLGHEEVRHQIDKTAEIAACPRPKSKKLNPLTKEK
ncbi:hypothetical protein PGIGA_G00190970 [Pangasianodon gigas]|uniref:Uncharacterized protein n=1 Tax=Pangasianodon gigas TaxID=30993 RepID=A0ACC5WDD7_PANGG|nr:hypothetical protein [Pangasianodon gigas]